MSLEDMLGLADTSDEVPIPPVALTIAGSDSGGGAGVQADLKTFAAARTHGTSVVTLVTAQNTRGVRHMEMLSEQSVRAQFYAVVEDLPPAAAKTGALGEEAIIALVSELLAEHPVESLVLDPVMISKHGDPLLPEAARQAFLERLLEHALVVTPNQYEAEALTGRSVGSLEAMRDAARHLHDLGARNVLIKGSLLDENVVRDLLYDGSGFIEFGADRVTNGRLHGSGCVYSAAITARLAHGDPLEEAVGFARSFITAAIAEAPALGGGISPVHPLHRLWS